MAGAFENMGGPAEEEFGGAVNPNSKFADYDASGLEALAADENAPSPNGAASQGAFGPPPSGGEDPSVVAAEGVDGDAALGDEGPKDMLSIFNQSTQESRDFLTNKVTESYAPLGYSLEGAMDNALLKGGPQAMARAAQFGIDLTPFANKVNPEGAYNKKGQSGDPRKRNLSAGGQPSPSSVEVGQAFGNVPTDEQVAGGGPFKDQEQAAGEMEGALAANEEEIRVKKLEQRQAIAAFLIEAGLRTLASDRDDAASAMGEGALGTMEARRERKQQSEQDTIAEAQRKRTERRQDEQDEAGKLEAQRKEQDRQYGISQRGAEEAKTARSGMQSVTNPDGEVYYFDPLDPESGKWVEDAEGNRVKSEDVGLSKESVETSRRTYENRINSKVEKIKAMSEFDRIDMYPETDGLTGKKLVTAIIKAAQAEAAEQSEQEQNIGAEDDPLGLL